MIKTYDEALKTLNDIRTYLVIGKADDCVQELDKVAKYFINEKHKENPSFSDCIKKWADRGWKVTQLNSKLLNIYNFVSNTVIEINMLYKNFRVFNCIDQSWSVLDFENLELLTNTIKALGDEDEET